MQYTSQLVAICAFALVLSCSYSWAAPITVSDYGISGVPESTTVALAAIFTPARRTYLHHEIPNGFHAVVGGIPVSIDEYFIEVVDAQGTATQDGVFTFRHE